MALLADGGLPALCTWITGGVPVMQFAITACRADHFQINFQTN